MYYVKVEWIKEDKKSLKLMGTCDYLPVLGYTFSIIVRQSRAFITADFGAVMECRNDYNMTTFRTTDGVFDLQVVQEYPPYHAGPNVIDLNKFKRRKKEGENKVINIGSKIGNPSVSKEKINKIIDLFGKSEKINENNCKVLGLKHYTKVSDIFTDDK